MPGVVLFNGLISTTGGVASRESECWSEVRLCADFDAASLSPFETICHWMNRHLAVDSNTSHWSGRTVHACCGRRPLYNTAIHYWLTVGRDTAWSEYVEWTVRLQPCCIIAQTVESSVVLYNTVHKYVLNLPFIIHQRIFTMLLLKCRDISLYFVVKFASLKPRPCCCRDLRLYEFFCVVFRLR